MMTDTAGRKKIFSIKWKMLSICVLLIAVPTITLGLLSYRTFKIESYNNIENDLRLIATDWQIMTQAYIEQNERILKREESLVKQRLGSIVLNVKKMILLQVDIHGTHLPEEVRKKLFGAIETIEIGRSGYVALFDPKGRYLISEDGKYGGCHMFEAYSLNAEDKHLIDNTLQKTRQSNGNDVYSVVFGCNNIEQNKERKKLAVLTYLEPWDVVIAAVTYYTDFKSYEVTRKLQRELKYKIADQRIGKNGYLWVINRQGDYIVSKDRLRDGENILDAKDHNNEYFIQKLINTAIQLKQGETSILYYSWKNIGEEEPAFKVTSIGYVPEWDWIIGASAYQREFLSGLKTITLQIIIVCLIAMILGSLIAYFFISYISRPIEKLEEISQKAAQGHLALMVDKTLLAQNDEIGNLANAFNIMITNLSKRVTELVRAKDVLSQREKELRKSETSLANAQEIAKIGSWEHDLISEKSTWSNQLYRILGYSPEEIQPDFHTWGEAIHPDDKYESKEFFEKCRQGLNDRTIEYRICRKDRAVRHVFVKCHTLFGSDNHPIKMHGIIQDITDRKIAELERENLIRELNDALENVKTLSGLLPICCHCKKIRDDKGYWNQIDSYIETHSDAQFSHGMCPECSDELYGKESWYIAMKKKKALLE